MDSHAKTAKLAMSVCSTNATSRHVRLMVAIRWIVLQNTAASFIWADLRIAQRSPLRASYGIIGLHAWQTGYAVQVTAADGGGRQRNLTRRRRF